MMLPSPVTSTPFSVKDILNLEQQQDPHYGAQLPHHLEHHFHPAACLLAAADGTRFSDGEEEEEEEKLSYLSPMAAPVSQPDARISTDNYVHAVLRGSCEAPGPGEDLDAAARDPSEYQSAPHCRDALAPRETFPARWASFSDTPVPAVVASQRHVEPGLTRLGVATAHFCANLAAFPGSASAGCETELSAQVRAPQFSVAERGTARLGEIAPAAVGTSKEQVPSAARGSVFSPAVPQR